MQGSTTPWKVLLEHRQKTMLIAKEDVKANSRLIVEKKGDAVTKTSYASEKSTQLTVWEKYSTTAEGQHNLPTSNLASLALLGEGEHTGASSSDAPESAESESASADPSMDDLSDVGDQFDGCINDNDEAWEPIKNLSSYGANTGEMLVQQAVYPALTLVRLAAASENPTFAYVADQEVLSSSFVTHRDTR